MLRLSRNFGKRENVAGKITDISDAVQRALRSTAYAKAALTARTQFQALESGGDGNADLALHAERLQRDRIVGAADQYVAADADAERRAALRAGVVAGQIAQPQSVHRREHAPGQRRFLGDAE